MVNFSEIIYNQLKVEQLSAIGEPPPLIARLLESLEASVSNEEDKSKEAEKNALALQVAAKEIEAEDAKNAVKAFKKKHSGVIEKVSCHGFQKIEDVKNTEAMLADYAELMRNNPLALKVEQPPISREELFQIGCQANNCVAGPQEPEDVKQEIISNSPQLRKLRTASGQISEYYIERETKDMPLYEKEKFGVEFRRNGFKALKAEVIDKIAESHPELDIKNFFKQTDDKRLDEKIIKDEQSSGKSPTKLNKPKPEAGASLKF